jgi:hypothetical protein
MNNLEKEQSQRIFLRCQLRGKYLATDPIIWESETSAAHSFRSVLEALRFCQEHELDSVEAVILRPLFPPFVLPLKSCSLDMRNPMESPVTR